MTITEDRPLAEEDAVLTTTRPADVVAAVARVMAEIGGIGKLTAQQRAQRGMGGGDTGITYAYRGIDQIAAAAQPLLGKYGVVIVPTCIMDSRVEQFTINNRPWTDTWLRVHWTVYGPGGLDDHFGAESEGLGRDNSDKGPNKAMTAAHKNLIIRLLMIGDPSDDTDGHTAERDPAPAQPAGPLPLSDQWKADFKTKVESEGFEVDAVMWNAFGNVIPDPLMPSHVPAMRDAVERMKQAQEAPELRHDANPGGTEVPADSWVEPQLPEVSDSRPVTHQQVGLVKAEYIRLEYDRDRQLKLSRSIVERRIETHNQLTYDEAEKLLEALRRIKTPEAPSDQ
jgi:hypothetical protein